VNPWWWVPIGLAAWCAVAVVLALVIGPVLAGDSRRPGRRAARGRRCRCGDCRTESALAPARRRVRAVFQPGPGQAARVRYGLTRREHAERLRSGLPVRHPDWLTGELPEYCEELLAELESETWEAE